MAALLFLMLGVTSPKAQEVAVENQDGEQFRVALLIGNAVYTGVEPDGRTPYFDRLTNPCRDVEGIREALEYNHWKPTQIISLCDANIVDLTKAIGEFVSVWFSLFDAAAGHGARPFGLIYYAGHGLQLKDDTVLFATDATIPDNIAAKILDHPGGNPFVPGGFKLAADILSKIGETAGGSLLVVVDACRDSLEGYYRSDPVMAQKFLNATRAYALPDTGIEILYSTRYGEKASDGSLAGSPFALSFKTALQTYERVDDVVGVVINDVAVSTRNAPLKQVPDSAGHLFPPSSKVCFKSCAD